MAGDILLNADLTMSEEIGRQWESSRAVPCQHVQQAQWDSRIRMSRKRQSKENSRWSRLTLSWPRQKSKKHVDKERELKLRALKV